MKILNNIRKNVPTENKKVDYDSSKNKIKTSYQNFRQRKEMTFHRKTKKPRLKFKQRWRYLSK